MNLGDVRKAPLKWKKKFPVGKGHGSGLGKNAGKGSGRGQKGRQGHSLIRYFEGGQMPLVRKLPKRGFNNRRFGTEYVCVNVSDLQVFQDGETVTPEKLLEKRIVTRFKDGVKILGEGALQRKLAVEAHAFSKKAQEAIAKAGGTVKVLLRFPAPVKPLVISARLLQANFNDGETVTPERLAEKGILRDKTRKVKITWGGLLTKKLTVHAHEFSWNAIGRIRKAGGRAVVIPEAKK